MKGKAKKKNNHVHRHERNTIPLNYCIRHFDTNHDGGREGSTLRARRCYCFERRIEMRRSFSSSSRSRSDIRCCRWWFSVWSSTECWPTVLMAGPAVLTAELLMSPDIVFELSEHNMEPEPVRSQEGDISNSNTIFCIAETPTLLLPLDISVIIEELIPNLFAKSFLSLTTLFFNRYSYACMKRIESSFFCSIIQNIEFYRDYIWR